MYHREQAGQPQIRVSDSSALPPVTQAVESLDRSLNLLGDFIQRLYDRLGIALRPEPDSPPKPSGVVGSNSPLTNKLRDMEEIVDGYRERLATLLERIEL